MPTEETGHPPLQDFVNHSDFHVAHHPISELPLPNVTEAQSTLNESDTVTALQYSELSVPDLTFSTIHNHNSVGELGMGMGSVGDNQLGPARPNEPNTDPSQMGADDLGEPYTERANLCA